MKWYKRNMVDYARDTASLTMTEDGAYNRLLDAYYSSEKPLPAEKPAIYRITRAIERWEQNAVDSVLAKFFQLTSDGYIQRRTERELAQYKKAAALHIANLGPNLGSQNAREKLELRSKKKKEEPPSSASVTCNSPPSCGKVENQRPLAKPARDTTLPDEEKQNRDRKAIEARDQRLEREAEVNRELHVGEGPSDIAARQEFFAKVHDIAGAKSF